MAFEPTPDKGCAPVKLPAASLLPVSVQHERNIDRSELTRQHEVKPTQHDDGHAKLTNDREHNATM
jgi:hypothetical protein